MLFPGDAQWGTWNAVLRDEEWRDLLQRITFYKIGHHGSHNATPREFVEDLLPTGLACMASTLTRSVWPDIPRKPLLKALAAKHASIARSDQARQARGPFESHGDFVELKLPL
jgi:beta-lactamase superfamily II metal-dependent hydrolase